MSQANGPLNSSSSMPDFPSIVSSEALQQQASYAASDGGNRSGHDANGNVEALAQLVQELNQQNHELLDRVSILDAELAQYRQNLNSQSVQPSLAASVHSDTLDGAAQEQVTHLLNHLEFTQQANQRQGIRIESLSMQLEDSQTRIAQLEAENSELQQRYGDRVCQLNQLSEECRDLRLRLQRQQQYTLQFKTALEKCLEVPPPSYSYFDGTGDFTLATGEPDSAPSNSAHPSPQPDDDAEADINWFVQPLFPKVQHIQSWATVQQERRQDLSKSVVNTHPSYKTSERDKASDKPHPLLPRERMGDGAMLPREADHSSTTPSVFQNFPRPRFQSTLLNLAREDEDVSAVSRSSATIADVKPTETVEPTATTLPEAEASDAPPASVLSPPDKQNERGGEQVPQSFSYQITDDFQSGRNIVAEQCEPDQGDNEDSNSELPDRTSGKISPFSSVPQPIGDNDATDDKLWHSLITLIDLSAADGLNLPSEPETKTKTEMGSEEQAEMTSSTNSETFQPLGIATHAERQSGTTTDFSQPAIDEISPTLDQKILQAKLGQDERTRSKVSRRVIDLPSFHQKC